MTKETLRVVVPALAVALLPLAGPGPAQAAQVETLSDAVGHLTGAPEKRAGYTRGAFRHWIDKDGDGCSTRMEVLTAEAIRAPAVGAGCTLTGGRWLSYYDRQEVADAGALAVDHLVPLAEAWDSGAAAWTAKRRERYANDLGAEASLAAVTVRTKRSKGGKDPAEWLPPATGEHCRYIAEWVGTKLRWGLTADDEERRAVEVFAEGPCETTVVHYTTVP